MTQDRLIPDPPPRVYTNLPRITHRLAKLRRELAEIPPLPENPPEWTDEAQMLEDSPNPWEHKVRLNQRIWRWGEGPWYSESVAATIERGEIATPAKDRRGVPPWRI